MNFCTTNLLLSLLALAVVPSASFLLDQSFDEYVEDILATYNIPGLSIAVIDSENITSKGYGFSNLPSTKATADTLYFAGSTTKAFTAAAAGVIVQNQEKFLGVKWTTPLSELLPESFALQSDYATLHTTLEDALSHRSGLPRHEVAYGWDNMTTADIIKTMRHLPLTAEPRTRFQYSNLMYATVGELVKKLTGESLGDVLDEWFWQPLGMRSTTFDLQAAKRLLNKKGERRLARGYFWVSEKTNSGVNSEKGGYFVPDPYYDISPMAGAGATISNVNDYALWVRTLLSTAATVDSLEKLNLSSPITPALYRELVSSRTIGSPLAADFPRRFASPPTYALGWVISQVGGYPVITHNGGLPGFSTQVSFMPNEALGFVSMANTEAYEASGLIYGEVIKRKFKGSSIKEADMKEFVGITTGAGVSREESTHEESKRTRSDDDPKGRSCDTTKRNQIPEKSSEALPGSVSEYLGTYYNPGYGLFNITLGNTGESFCESHHRLPFVQQIEPPFCELPMSANNKRGPTFVMSPSPRLWKFRIVLMHKSYTSFIAKTSTARGPIVKDAVEFVTENSDESCGKRVHDSNVKRNLDCKNEVVWDPQEDGQAIFVHGPDNGKVQWLGVEMEQELVRWAKEEGTQWNERFIWFEKRSELP